MNSGAKVDALDAGADDYVTKPFSVEELFARIRAVTRRTAEPELLEPVRLGRWTVDFNDHVICEASTAPEASAPQVHLTPTEWQLLEALVRHPGRLVSQRQLLQEVWGSDLRRPNSLPTSVREGPPTQARGRFGAAAPFDHRARNGLSLPAVKSDAPLSLSKGSARRCSSCLKCQ
jgi:CheY-like chemotaxis protein